MFRRELEGARMAQRSLDLRSVGGPVVLVGLVLLVLPLLIGCGGGVRSEVRTEFYPFSPEETALMKESQGARYRLRVGDDFSVDFKFENGLDQRHIRILPDGRFTMAGLEDMQAAGLTLAELDSAITAHFARDYRNPDLSIIIEQIAAYQIYVLGEVKLPGLKDLPPTGAGVLQAIAVAGGFTEDAASSETVIMRVTPQGFMYRRCDLSHIEQQGFLSPDFLDIQPFDVVYVPRTPIADLVKFTKDVLGSSLSFTNLFWDIYSIVNIDQVQRIVR